MTDPLTKRMLLVFVFVCVIVGAPLSMRMGLFSFFFNTAEGGTTGNEVVYAIGSNAQTMPLLKAATHADPNPAKGGGDIIVNDGTLVSGGSSNDSDKTHSPTANGEISIYVVKGGDTLSQIAEMFGVSEKTILWANDIKNGIIHPGQELVILPITGVQYVIKKGDTVSSIAKKFGGEVNDILAYNQLGSADEISVGDTIVIPGGEIAQPATPKHTSSPSSSGGHTITVSGSGSDGFIPPLAHYVKTQGLHGYNGVDLAGPYGETVVAAAGGTVIVAKNNGGYNGGYGNYVVIKHPNGVQTLYAHLSAVSVGIGQHVVQGQKIGAEGSTGRSTGPHVHFEVRGARNPF